MDTSMTYDDVVKTAELTCDGCPTIYEGRLTNGDSYYVRYRHGVVRFENESKNLTATASLQRMADGVLSYDEFREYVVTLHEETLEEWGTLLEDLADQVREEAEKHELSDEIVEQLTEDDKLEELFFSLRAYDTTLEEFVKSEARM